MPTINWRVRAKNATFWLTLIPAVLLLAQAVAGVAGITLDTSELSRRLVAVVNAAFTVLAVLGIVADPTTATLSDSQRAMGYEVPFRDGGEDE